jgi:hypothetical protein
VGSGLVGYQVRLDSKTSAKTRLTYCTTGTLTTQCPFQFTLVLILFSACVGVLLRRLQDPRCLQQLSHIVLDEVHERGVRTNHVAATNRALIVFLWCAVWSAGGERLSHDTSQAASPSVSTP